MCTLLGQLFGELLGFVFGVNANVGGVGIAMLLLIATRHWLRLRGLLSGNLVRGVMIWGSLYIPIVVAMAAQEDVVAALEGGPLILVGGVLVVAMCFGMVALIGRVSRPGETMDEIEARERMQVQAVSATMQAES